MSLSAGTKLGPYEIVAPIGAGGMGEVYRARDTRLDRIVAIKILPSHLSGNPEAKQRFEREARAISSLSHPNICHLYDVGAQDGLDYIVMEYLEGETLADRLQKGALPLEQLLRYGVEISEGLDKAHRSGVIHRDLKPGNIMLTKTGAKLMDFGLAKSAGVSAVNQPASALTQSLSPAGISPTAPLTAQGSIVGTFQYMSPEQVEGKEADGRSDNFSLGTVLYEMATGKRAFEGKTAASAMAAVLERDPPPVSSLQPMTPAALERVIKKCLAKDADARWQSASDLASELQWIATVSQSGAQPGSAPGVTAKGSRRALFPWILAVLALAMAAAFAARPLLQSAPGSAPRARWVIGAPENAAFHASGDGGGPVVVAPDGQRLAFVAVDASGKQQLWLRPLDALKAEIVPGTEGASYPFWSPDSRSLGFFSNGQLKRVSTEGGAVVPLCDVTVGRGGTWNQQGTIVFSRNVEGGWYQVSTAGGKPTQLTQVDLSQHDSHRWPSFLPDGQHFLFMAGGHDDLSHAHDGIYVGSLDGQASKLLMPTHANVFYAAGHLLYLNESTLMARPFDLRRLELTGEAEVVEEGVEADPGYWLGVFSASQNGVLAFAPANPNSGNQLSWFSSTGKQLGVVGELGRYGALRLSPDGQQLAVEHEQPHHQVWIYDLKRNSKSQFTFGNFANAYPLWSPDGKEIVFTSDRKGHADLYRKSTDGSQTENLLLESPNGKYPQDWSPDGKYLLYQESKHNKSGLWLLPMQGQQAPRLLLEDPFYSEHGAFSPDGRWIAYTSSEQGARQIFVMPFPGPGAKRQISSTGAASHPFWRRDGGAVIYKDDSGNVLETTLSVRNSELTVGSTRLLFPAGPDNLAMGGLTLDLAPDGRFLVTTRSQENKTQIVVVFNWDAGLKK